MNYVIKTFKILNQKDSTTKLQRYVFILISINIYQNKYNAIATIKKDINRKLSVMLMKKTFNDKHNKNHFLTPEFYIVTNLKPSS